MSSIIADNAQSYIVTLSLTSRLSRCDSLHSEENKSLTQTDDENDQTVDEKKILAPELLVVNDDDQNMQQHQPDDNEPSSSSRRLRLRAEAAAWERDIFPSVRVIGGEMKLKYKRMLYLYIPVDCV
jgi:hypothetical protein